MHGDNESRWCASVAVATEKSEATRADAILGELFGGYLSVRVAVCLRADASSTQHLSLWQMQVRKAQHSEAPLLL